MKLAFLCTDDPHLQGEWSVVEVDADTIERGWQLATIETGKLGWPEEAMMYFLGHSC